MTTTTSYRQVPSAGSLKRWLSVWNYSILLMVILQCSAFATSAYGQGDDGGKFDGAIWKFSMTPKDKKLEKREGMFRVHGNDLYQRIEMDKPGDDRKVGKKTLIKAPRNKKGKIIGREETIIEFFDLQSNGRKYTEIKGKAVLTKDKLGEWSGRFVDAEGLHWTFKCSRKQE